MSPDKPRSPVLSTTIQKVLSGEYTFESVAKGTTEAPNRLKLSVSSQNYNITYWIDMERGSIPVRREDVRKSDGLTISETMDDIRFVEGAGWLPFVWTRVVGRSGLTIRVVVEEAKCIRRPDGSAFVLEFPKPRRMLNSARSVIYTARKVWDLTNLPADNSRQSTRYQLPTFQPPPSMPDARRGSRLASWVLVGIGTTICVVTIALYLRRRPDAVEA